MILQVLHINRPHLARSSPWAGQKANFCQQERTVTLEQRCRALARWWVKIMKGNLTKIKGLWDIFYIISIHRKDSEALNFEIQQLQKVTSFGGLLNLTGFPKHSLVKSLQKPGGVGLHPPGFETLNVMFPSAQQCCPIQGCAKCSFQELAPFQIMSWPHPMGI